MRDSFVMYTSYREQIEMLSLEQRGVLLTAVLAYESGSELPKMDDVVGMAFAFIKARLDVDNAKWEEAIAQRRKAGQASAQARKRKSTVADSVERKGTVVDSVEREPTNSTDNVFVFVNDIEKGKKNKKEKRPFVPPTVEQVREYCTEKGYQINPESFVSYYASKGWTVGKSPMKDWRQACVTWEARRKADAKAKRPQIEQHEYDFDAIERALIAAQG